MYGIFGVVTRGQPMHEIVEVVLQWLCAVGLYRYVLYVVKCWLSEHLRILCEIKNIVMDLESYAEIGSEIKEFSLCF